MGFILNVGSINLGVDVITSVNFLSNTPEDSNARTTDQTVTMKVCGKVLANLDNGSESSIELAKWAMVSAEEADCYKDLSVQVTAAGQVVRDYKLPNAFVVDYKEFYGDTEGVGTFELIVRQKKNNIKSVAVTGGYGA